MPLMVTFSNLFQKDALFVIHKPYDKLRIMNIHDSGYKFLFSMVAFFQQLVETFVEETWVKQHDFSRATLLDKSFVSAAYENSEADLLWQVPLQGRNQFLYFYLLLEFQSTVPRLMALRVGQYLLSAKSDLQRIHNHATILPQIFPIVLYNGKERWTAPSKLSELEEQVVDLGEYGIEVSYLPIIENSYPLERLLRDVNLVSTLFMAEAYYDQQRIIQQLLTLFEQSNPKAVSALANWFEQMTIHKRIPVEDYRLLEREYRSKEELQTMIVEAILKEEEQIARKNKAEGKDEGKREMNRLHVQRMTAKGYTLPVIADLLGLSEAEVQTYLSEEVAESLGCEEPIAKSNRAQTG